MLCYEPMSHIVFVCMQYHEVRLNFVFESASQMALNGVDTSVAPEAVLFATYCYLDSAERKRFSQNSHEYLITVLQVRLLTVYSLLYIYRLYDMMSHFVSCISCSTPAQKALLQEQPARHRTPV
jgi:hypothetical protein